MSWAEYVLGSAIDHYGADPATVDIKLVAAIEGKDFVHTFDSEEESREMFAGWEELGFIHNTTKADGKVECLIDYREMIEWQLKDSIQDFGLRQYMNDYSVDLSEVINTGDLSLGHASHHAAEHYGTTENGRDWYIVGLKHEPELAEGNPTYEFDASRPWSARNHPWMKASQYMYEQLRTQDPSIPEVDDPDPMIRMATIQLSKPIAPRKFWDTPEMWERSRVEHMHPYTLWSISSTSTAEVNDPEYIAWIEGRNSSD